MIVINPDNIKLSSDKECLFQRFGQGVHLIKSRDSNAYHLLIMSCVSMPALFVNINHTVTWCGDDPNKIEYSDFDSEYLYIKKLDGHELMVEI